jgi:hypothetical protein
MSERPLSDGLDCRRSLLAGSMDELNDEPYGSLDAAFAASCCRLIARPDGLTLRPKSPAAVARPLNKMPFP